MMEKLIIQMYESEKSKPEKTVTIPLSRLDIGSLILPTQVKAALDKEGINLNSLAELTGKSVAKGTLIEVQTGKEKVVIEVE